MCDSLGKESTPDTVEAFPSDTPPEPVIESPTAGTLFRVGQEFTAQGSATDAEDDGDPSTAHTLSSGTWVFDSWSKGAARDHAITSPADPTTYTATFKRL